jgi:hypothetical protein
MSQLADARPWVAKYRATQAHEFLDLLSPVSGVFGGERGLPYQFLFRGVSDVSFSLIPSAFRADAKLFQQPHRAVGPGQTNGQQIERELTTLVAFINAADRQGHTIPEDTQELRAELKFLDEQLSYAYQGGVLKEWPPSSLLSALALAQHYGVPTRLLDWSLDVYVAAYFAAAGAVSRSNEPGDLAVWAVPTDVFTLNELLVGDSAAVAKLPVQHVTTPWAGNANAKAQKAVFLAYRQFEVDLDAGFERRSYDELLVKNLHGGLNEGPSLFCLSLPKSEAPHLLRYLAFQGYDGATMFPDLDGAVKSIRESYLWPKEFGPDPRTEQAKTVVSGWFPPSKPEPDDPKPNEPD